MYLCYEKLVLPWDLKSGSVGISETCLVLLTVHIQQNVSSLFPLASLLWVLSFSQQVETALNNVRVLDEMLSRHQESPASQPDLDLMMELHSSCASLRANLYRLVSEMDDKDEGIGGWLMHWRLTWRIERREHHSFLLPFVPFISLLTMDWEIIYVPGDAWHFHFFMDKFNSSTWHIIFLF